MPSVAVSAEGARQAGLHSSHLVFRRASPTLQLPSGELPGCMLQAA